MPEQHDMNIDDPKLTAFALGELDEAEESRIARAVTESPEAQRLVDEMRELSAALKNEFASELKSEKAPANVIDFPSFPAWLYFHSGAKAFGLPRRKQSGFRQFDRSFPTSKARFKRQWKSLRVPQRPRLRNFRLLLAFPQRGS